MMFNGYSVYADSLKCIWASVHFLVFLFFFFNISTLHILDNLLKNEHCFIILVYLMFLLDCSASYINTYIHPQ